MGKFAGFWKRIKNFANNIGTYTINGLSKINDVYKNVYEKIKPGIDTVASFIPGGSVISWIADKGLNKVSDAIDMAKYGIDNPNTFYGGYNNRKNLPNGIRPIRIDAYARQEHTRPNNNNNTTNNFNPKIRNLNIK